MRITNQMIQNNSLNNISINKTQMNTLDTQLSSQKKISRPSEDPIIAIRALRLRTSLSEVEQYLKKNIPDANSWLDVSEGALKEANDIIEDVYDYCVQGSTDTLSLNEREILSTSLKQLREALYAQGDVDYAGRYVFTGFRTDTSLTFKTDEQLADADYTITQNFTAQDFDFKSVVTSTVDLNAVKTMTGTQLGALTDAQLQSLVDVNAIGREDVHRIRLAYTDVKPMADAAITINYEDAAGNPQTFGTITESVDPNRVPGSNEILFNPETGELLFGDQAYTDLFAIGEFSVTYDKDSFQKGDCRPEHYFTCTQRRADGEIMPYEKDPAGQSIEYIVNFNQKLRVNSEASDCFKIDMGRDIDEIINAVDNAVAAEKRRDTLKELKENPNYASDEAQKKLDKLIEGAEKELDYYNDILQKTFEAGITNMQNHQENIDIEMADIGNRMKRLELTKTRLKSQHTNFTDLKSSNEDIDLEEVVINYSSAELVYNASLTAGSKVVRQTLLDFI